VNIAKGKIMELYSLPIEDTTAVSRRTAWLLEDDRFMCDPKGYKVGKWKDILVLVLGY
jgi:hypothetical protein